jgi:glycosyltransferase involved in cell wall biosynthesis
MSDAPKVSVLIATYNHERYIAQAVTSALTQDTNFPMEVIVGEDCSTDGTRRVLLNLQRQYPTSLKLLLHDPNIGGGKNVAAVLAACRGEYVAMLEGDDYWTDPRKLQKQADALDANRSWSACFHPTRMVYEDGSQQPRTYPDNWTRPFATIEDLFRENFICTCSIVFRNGLFGPLPAWHQETVPGDWAIHMLNAHHGPIGFLPEVMADYRIHPQGLWTSKTHAQQHAEVFRMLSRVDHHFQGQYARQIDEYRIDLVSRLSDWLQRATAHAAALEAERRLREERRAGRPAAIKAVLSMGRKVEDLSRRARTAVGLRKKAG